MKLREGIGWGLLIAVLAFPFLFNILKSNQNNHDDPPKPPDQRVNCTLVKEKLTFEEAQAYMEHFVTNSNQTHADLAIRYGNYPKGDNVPDCMIYAMNQLMSIEPYRLDHGISFRYGMKNAEDNRETERYAIFFPIGADGKFNTILIEDKKLSYMELPPNFNDPCPDWCD